MPPQLILNYTMEELVLMTYTYWNHLYGLSIYINCLWALEGKHCNQEALISKGENTEMSFFISQELCFCFFLTGSHVLIYLRMASN